MSAPPKRLLVVRPPDMANTLAAMLPDWHVAPLFGALTGRTFDQIFVAAGPYDERDYREIENHLPTRLMPGGNIIVL